ncbi:MAG: EAL domain-containing protein [Planctomycetota bacterium]|nr:EAL domain-containing protein [Planctomycetota bacterium]
MPVTVNSCRPNTTSLEGLEWYLCGSVSDGERSRETVISQQRFQAGRRSSCDLRLSWPTVSGVHAEFIQHENALLLRDLGSTNGTFVNGRRISTVTTLTENDVVHFGGVEFRLRKRSEEDSRGTMAWNDGDLISRLDGFEELIHGNGLIPYYQPIVMLLDATTVGYEVLARSRIPEFPTPREMFETAEQLDREDEFSEVCRREGVKHGAGMPPDQRLFLNTHPTELQSDSLIESLEKLRADVPDQLLSLEIHEAAVTDLGAMAELQRRLTDLDIQLAYDDFGAGQARMLDLVEVPPEVLKFDISLIRNIHQASPKRQKMVGTLVLMVKDFGIKPLAEGVETLEEAEACLDLGFEFAQGFYFGRPAASWQTSPEPTRI